VAGSAATSSRFQQQTAAGTAPGLFFACAFAGQARDQSAIKIRIAKRASPSGDQRAVSVSAFEERLELGPGLRTCDLGHAQWGTGIRLNIITESGAKRADFCCKISCRFWTHTPGNTAPVRWPAKIPVRLLSGAILPPAQPIQRRRRRQIRSAGTPIEGLEIAQGSRVWRQKLAVRGCPCRSRAGPAAAGVSSRSVHGQLRSCRGQGCTKGCPPRRRSEKWPIAIA